MIRVLLTYNTIMSSKLTAHMIVKNEEQWIWYAIQSVLPFVERMIIYDTGSIDATVAIVRRIVDKRISFQEKGAVSTQEMTYLRNQQIAETTTPWFMLIDGDEVWSRSGMDEIKTTIENSSSQITAFVHPCFVLLGDVYHHQSERAGKYHIAGHRGHFNIRVLRKRNNYKWHGAYPLEAYCDERQRLVQEKVNELAFMTTPYWHMTKLFRSRKRVGPKLEIGQKNDMQLPEVFNMSRPEIVASPMVKFSQIQNALAHIMTPLLSIKRLLQ